MNLLPSLNFSSMATALDEWLCVGVGIVNARLDFELLQGGPVEVEEVGLVRRDSKGRTNDG